MNEQLDLFKSDDLLLDRLERFVSMKHSIDYQKSVSNYISLEERIQLNLLKEELLIDLRDFKA